MLGVCGSSNARKDLQKYPEQHVPGIFVKRSKISVK